ncbi:hypothetical protein PLICRDRAFT_296261 [Plicaturopsis crispa FD-325 SS-3]|nr:hypothetical protein PLICRDRAFT_296261 [Plicaturopsis crispa FD-325 SS-3]
MSRVLTHAPGVNSGASSVHAATTPSANRVAQGLLNIKILPPILLETFRGEYPARCVVPEEGAEGERLTDTRQRDGHGEVCLSVAFTVHIPACTARRKAIHSSGPPRDPLVYSAPVRDVIRRRSCRRPKLGRVFTMSHNQSVHYKVPRSTKYHPRTCKTDGTSVIARTSFSTISTTASPCVRYRWPLAMSWVLPTPCWAHQQHLRRLQGSCEVSPARR